VHEYTLQIGVKANKKAEKTRNFSQLIHALKAAKLLGVAEREDPGKE
jgi:hypothetical protein